MTSSRLGDPRNNLEPELADTMDEMDYEERAHEADLRLAAISIVENMRACEMLSPALMLNEADKILAWLKGGEKLNG